MSRKRKNIWIMMLWLFMTCFICIPSVKVSADEKSRVEDYRGWSQGDSRWGSLRLGYSSYTVKKSGCLATSITKLFIQAGIKDLEKFDVGVFVKWMNKHGGFVGSGLLSWDVADKYSKKFDYCGNLMNYSRYSAKAYNKKLMNYIKKGYHLVINVKYGGHWVAVDEAKSLETGKIYIMDSASKDMKLNKNILLSNKYGTFNRVVGFKGGKTATMQDLKHLLNPPKEEKQETASKNTAATEVVTEQLVEKDKIYVVDKMKYKVTNDVADGTGTASLVGSKIAKKKLTSLTVKDTIEIGNVTFQVTEIGANAFHGYKALEKVVIGKNIKVLQKKCFYNCSKLKTIKVQSGCLEFVGKGAIKKVSKKVKISVPSKKKTKYMKLFKKGKK